LAKELAIKISKTRLPDEQDEHALREEGRILARLEHPGLARVLDFDLHEGKPFLALELVHGTPLSQYARHGPLAPREAARVVAQLARIMEYVHSRGITHQDLKTSNVILCERQPRIIDFGLARWQTAWQEEQPVSDQIVGTVVCMAPEQARGEMHRVDHRTDIFALGAILFRLLTGSHPFQGQTFAEALQRAQACDFDATALHRQKVPPALTRICLKAMSSVPADRFENAAQLAKRLEGFASFTRRRLAIAAILLLVTFCVALPALLPDDKPSSTTPLVQQFEILHRQNADGVTVYSGRLGERQPREDDDLRVAARFSRPVYSFLIAFNPDGSQQLCVPADPETAPRPSSSLSFPDDPSFGFGLTDGSGQQAFALIVSETRLPAFREWQEERQAQLNWRSSEQHGFWRFDGQSIQPYASERNQTRGQVRRLKGSAEFDAFCQDLRQTLHHETAHLVSFPVHSSSAFPSRPLPIQD
jgi:serine/threonine protein kinase